MKLALIILLTLFLVWLLVYKPGLSIFSNEIVPVRDDELIELNRD